MHSSWFSSEFEFVFKYCWSLWGDEKFMGLDVRQPIKENVKNAQETESWTSLVVVLREGFVQ